MEDIRGSTWNKWDLHVHSPESYQYKGTWDEFKKQLLNGDCKVIGINDYSSVSGYKKITEEINKGDFNLPDKVLFPVVEFRMTNSVQNKSQASNGVTHFNFHIIFDNKADIQHIESFVNAQYANGTTIGSFINDKEKLLEAKVDFNEVLSNLKKDINLKGKFLIWLPYDEYGGIDEIDSQSDGWIKSEFIKKSDFLGSSNEKQKDFFLWKSPLDKNNKEKFSQDQFESWFNVKKPCIKGSDSHDSSYPIGKLKDAQSKPINKYCWIKASLTFFGLKQAVYDPEDRVFVGPEPEIFSRTELNDTKYIKELKISSVDGYDNAQGVWFKNETIPFNNELIAIIGNKGSGKSAIADILGLLGDSPTNKEHYSFLNKNKFLKKSLASNFHANLKWLSGGESGYKALDSEVDKSSHPSVQYVPQSYFESLTNELEIKSFRRELESIIFEYIPEHKRLSQETLRELIFLESKNINRAITDLKENNKSINREIVNLEKDLSEDSLKSLNSSIEEKKRELHSAKELLSQKNKDLKKIQEQTSSSSDGDDGSFQSIIDTERKNLDELNNEIENYKNHRINNSKDLSELEHLIERFNKLEQWLETLKIETKPILDKHSYKFEDVFKYHINTQELLSKKSETIKQGVELDKYLKDIQVQDAHNFSEQAKDLSLLYKKNLIEEKIYKTSTKLSSEQKAIEDIKNEIGITNKKIQDINGSENSVGTLIYLENKLNNIKANNTKLIEDLVKERVDNSQSIFSEKLKLVELFNNFKEPIDQKLAINREQLKEHDIKIDASIYLSSDFYDDFFSHVNQSKSGSYRNKDNGRSILDNILADFNFDSKEDVSLFLDKIISSFKIDLRQKHQGLIRNPYEQVLSMEEFYNFIFSLDFLLPEYHLKLSDKNLENISPGERGALLLIFYLMLDPSETPLIIDQPEDNLDNESVFSLLTSFVKSAKKRKQIFMVTHNPNLAVGADAEQILYVNIDKSRQCEFSKESGAIENEKINNRIVQILEGTKPAFDKRKLKYS